MKSLFIYAASAVLALTLCTFAATGAAGAGQTGALVRLQTTTPGRAQRVGPCTAQGEPAQQLAPPCRPARHSQARLAA